MNLLRDIDFPFVGLGAGLPDFSSPESASSYSNPLSTHLPDFSSAASANTYAQPNAEILDNSSPSIFSSASSAISNAFKSISSTFSPASSPAQYSAPSAPTRSSAAPQVRTQASSSSIPSSAPSTSIFSATPTTQSTQQPQRSVVTASSRARDGRSIFPASTSKSALPWIIGIGAVGLLAIVVLAARD